MHLVNGTGNSGSGCAVARGQYAPPKANKPTPWPRANPLPPQVPWPSLDLHATPPIIRKGGCFAPLSPPSTALRPTPTVVRNQRRIRR